MKLKDRMGYYMFLALFSVFFFPAHAFSEGKYLAYDQPNPVNSPNIFWELTKVILALAFVLGIAYFFLQMLSKKTNLISKGESIHVLENTYLAQNKIISLVTVGNKILVLGVTEQTITYLTEITDAETIATLQEKRQTESSNVQPVFADQLQQFMQKMNFKEKTNEEGAKARSDQQTASEYSNLQTYFQERMQKIRTIEGKPEKEDDER